MTFEQRIVLALDDVMALATDYEHKKSAIIVMIGFGVGALEYAGYSLTEIQSLVKTFYDAAKATPTDKAIASIRSLRELARRERS